MTALLSVEQVAAELGLSHSAVRSLLADGKIESRRVGRRWYVTRPCLDAYLAPAPFPDPPSPPPDYSPTLARERRGRGRTPRQWR